MAGPNEDFCFPIPPTLENARLQLVPWNPILHASDYVQRIRPYPELFDYLPFGPFDSQKSFDSWYEGRIRAGPTQIAFAIFDKTRETVDGRFAGMIGLLNASAQHLSVEMGFLTILPKFQRTHVSSNAVGLLLGWLLNPPTTTSCSLDSQTGLGLRRVYWNANTLNTRSIALAERLGMKLEAIFRWERVLPVDRSHFAITERARRGDPKEEHPGRDTAQLAICWDDWLTGGRERVHRVMQRII